MSLNREYESFRIGMTVRVDITSTALAELVLLPATLPIRPTSFLVKSNVRAYIRQETEPGTASLELDLQPHVYMRIDVENDAQRTLYVQAAKAGETGEIKATRISRADGTCIKADFSGTPLTGIAPLTVQFTNASVGETTWTWDFSNDGRTESTAENPSYIYVDAGTYDVKLAVTNTDSTDDETKTAYVVAAAPTGLFAHSYGGEGGYQTVYTNQYNFTTAAVTASVTFNGYYWFGSIGNYGGAIFAGGNLSGDDTTNQAAIYKYVYATAVTTLSSTVLLLARCLTASCGHSTAGFICGGKYQNTGYAETVLCDKYTYATEAIEAATALATYRYRHAGFGNTAKGWITGGSQSAYYTTIYTTEVRTYATDAVTAGTTLTDTAMLGIAGASTSEVGILAGGIDVLLTAVTTTVRKYTLATDALTAGTSLSVGRSDAAAASNATEILIGGGLVSGGVATTSVEIYTIATDAVSTGTVLPSPEWGSSSPPYALATSNCHGGL